MMVVFVVWIWVVVGFRVFWGVWVVVGFRVFWGVLILAVFRAGMVVFVGVWV